MMPAVGRVALCSIVALTVTVSRLGPAAGAQAPAADGWRTFQGTWTATGQLQTLPTEAGRPAAVVRLSGTVTLSGETTALSRGFRGEAIAFDDGRSTNVGRAVWTDARGDRVFSELKGEPLQTGRRISGTITGGTGRYAGVTGDYDLTWQYVVQSEDESVNGRASDLRGRFRIGEARP
jgi:hypothetical protein